MIMAGYIFSLGKDTDLDNSPLTIGVYSYRLKNSPSGRWLTPYEMTCADFAAMQTGDNVYFFQQRKLYGVGILSDICGDCKFRNFPDANKPQSFNYDQIADVNLWGEREGEDRFRWLCTFKPDHHFFKIGVDIDEVLASSTSSFKMLPAFEKLSFIKIDEEENNALKDAILRANREIVGNPSAHDVFDDNSPAIHASIETKMETNVDGYRFNVDDILEHCATGDKLGHESALEAGFIHQLATISNHPDMGPIFGSWDYISHQVVASPQKATIWMDKMDVFGFSYISGYRPAKDKFLIVELKIGDALKDDIDQLLKYVDWVQEKYAYREYCMIHAFLVTYDFSQDVKDYAREVGVRRYTIGKNPARSLEWKNLKLITYRYNPTSRTISFHDA